MKVITNIQPLEMSKSLPQGELNSSFAWLMSYLENTDDDITNLDRTEETFKTKMDAVNSYGVSDSFIQQRRWYTFPDQQILNEHSDGPTLYPEFPSTEALHMGDRMAMYQKVVSEVIRTFYDGDELPDHIVHVSCSGYISPNPVEHYVASKQSTTMVTNCYHMGCYAAFPAVRMALGFLHSFGELGRSTDQIDIVHTEFLSLHFGETRGSFTAGDIVNYSLFGDGFVKYSMLDEASLAPEQKGLKVLSLNEVIIPNTEGEMTWDLGIKKFDMYLSKYVPLFIKQQISTFIGDLYEKAGFDFEQEKPHLFCAIHPGGPKILRHIQEELALTDEQMKHSYRVFYDNGNMSSCTTPYIWKEIIEDDAIPSGALGFSVAFGPGLTATALLFQKT